MENIKDHFQELKPLITEVIITLHFKRDTKHVHGFDTNQILETDHDSFTSLHKFEEHISGNTIFRALKEHVHYVYAIDKNYRLIFLRAFHNFNEYTKFLENKKEIIHMIENV